MRVMQVNIKLFYYFKYLGGFLYSVSLMHYLIFCNNLIKIGRCSLMSSYLAKILFYFFFHISNPYDFNVFFF